MSDTKTKIIVLKKTDDYTEVRLEGVQNLDKVSVMSGVELERTSDTLTLRLRPNDSLIVDGMTILWWDEGRNRFIRQ